MVYVTPIENYFKTTQKRFWFFGWLVLGYFKKWLKCSNMRKCQETYRNFNGFIIRCNKGNTHLADINIFPHFLHTSTYCSIIPASKTAIWVFERSMDLFSIWLLSSLLLLIFGSSQKVTGQYRFVCITFTYLCLIF